MDAPPSVIAARYDRNSKRTWYVSELPGQGGKDWGYTPIMRKAIPMSLYWAQRFGADCCRVGSGFTLFDSTILSNGPVQTIRCAKVSDLLERLDAMAAGNEHSIWAEAAYRIRQLESDLEKSLSAADVLVQTIQRMNDSLDGK